MMQKSEAKRASSFARCASIALARLRADMAVYLSIALYAAAGFVFLSMNHAQENANFAEYLKKAMLLGLFLFPLGALAADAVGVLHRFDRRRGLAFRRALSPRRFGSLLSGSAMLAAIMLFEGVFTSIKNTLVVWNGGFHFDRALADLDALLHFGADPWRMAAPLMEIPAARLFISYNYGIIWFLAAFGTVYFVASSPKADALRSRYLVSFMLVWVLIGNLMAGAFMSAGPAFYAQATGDGARFAGLAASLARGAAMGDATGMYQAYLWSLQESGQSGFASGISAFPSVHVGLMVMNALFAWDANRKLGWAMTAYCLLIFASSVALGWHYAVDGYASAVIVIAVHLVLKRVFGHAARARAEKPMTPVTAR
jgi:PAP2 superfamily